MENINVKIDRVLGSEAGFSSSSNNQANIVDYRFMLFSKIVDSFKNKDEIFYSELIELVSTHIDKLYDREVNYFNNVTYGENGEIRLLDFKSLNKCDIVEMKKANRELAKKLFNYVCDILSKNPDIKLSFKSLRCLLNRNPKEFPFMVEENYTFRLFDFERLVSILSKNKTLEKSNIDLDTIYQLLIDTCQINNESVFKSLVTTENYMRNHKKVDEVLMYCNSDVFVDITNIIINNYDENFDRFSFIKKRVKNNFPEHVIITLLKRNDNEKNFEFIHKILNDESININYDMYYADYFGDTTLKAFIAIKGNEIITKDLLSKKENINNTYWYGDKHVRLYSLYAIIGEYDKALEIFKQDYIFENDFEDFNDDFNKYGYTEGNYGYSDSLVDFISNLCISFESSDIDYSIKKDLIFKVLDYKNVKYVNLEEALSYVTNNLNKDDFLLLVDNLMNKYSNNKLNFIFSEEHYDLCTKCVIKIMSKEQIQEELDNLISKYDKKALKLN